MLRERGRYKEALAALRHGHELGSPNPRWRYPSKRWVEDCERAAAMEDKLALVLRGEASPADTRERLGLVDLCNAKKLRAAAARLYEEALHAEPRLVNVPGAFHRYNAACAATLASIHAER